MKKCMAMLLVLVMAFGIVGCSPAELGYMDLLKEASTMTGSTVEETVSMTIDKNLLKEAGLDTLGNYLELEVKGSADQSKMAVDMTIGYRLDKTSEFAPLTRLVMLDNKMVMSTKEIFAAMVRFNDQLKMSPEFITEMNAYLAANPYMDLDLAASYATLGITDVNAYMKDSQKMANDIFDLLVNNHSQFTTGLVTEKDGGYSITMNSKNLMDLVDKWLVYAQKNPTSTYNFFEGFMKMANTAAGTTSPTVTPTEFSTALGQVAAGWTGLKAELNAMTIDPKDGFESFEKMTGEAGARVYTGDMTFNVAEIGLNMVAKSTVTEGPVAISMPTKAVKREAFIASVEQIVNKHTVHNSTTIDATTLDVTLNTTFGGNVMSNRLPVEIANVDYTNYVLLEDLQAMLPGTQVIWDSGKTQACVIKNGVTTVVGHTMVESVPYAKVADLAKAGYTVEVVKTPTSTIVITPSK